MQALSKVPIWDACPFGLPMILTVAQMSHGQNSLSGRALYRNHIGSLSKGYCKLSRVPLKGI